MSIVETKLPSQPTAEELTRRGLKWSPAHRGWIRQLTSNVMWVVRVEGVA
ncbi:MAG: hypothetical protein RSP_18210 [Rhodanobacter sp.]